jgi:hypothetical protein
VAVETTFENLVAKLGALREVVASLQITVVEDRPLKGSVLLVERLGDAVDDLRGLVEEALSAATEALEGVGNPLDEYRARNSLATANRRFIRLEYKFLVDEMSCDSLNELTKLGRHHGHEWLAWTGSVLQALTECRGPLQDVDDALLLSWQDLSERLGGGGVSVHTTNIGQISAQSGEIRQGRGGPKSSAAADGAAAWHRSRA